MIRLSDLSRAVYANELRKLDVRLPLRLCDEEIGSVIDDEGLEIFVVDGHYERSDDDVSAIAALIVEAINARGGTPA
ncbi:hypothetical protein [Sphingomonas sp. UYP23]